MSKNIFKLIKSDLCAAKKRDPAARSYLEILLTYSGFHAILLHRVCHFFWKIHLKLLSRFIANISRIFTSIEIHPAVVIDEGFFTKNSCGNIFFASHQKDKIYELSNLGELVQIIEPIYETADPEILEGPNFVAPINYVHHLTDIKAKCGEIHLLQYW